jgi:hypothetical protein
MIRVFSKKTKEDRILRNIREVKGSERRKLLLLLLLLVNNNVHPRAMTFGTLYTLFHMHLRRVRFSPMGSM